MVEYVTKQTVIDELSRYGMTEDGEAIINAIPAADVVEVVRCRECYFRELDGADPVCTGAMAYSHTPDDWFCAAGKPKDGGQDNV